MVTKIKKTLRSDPVLVYKLTVHTLIAIMVVLIGVGIQQLLEHDKRALNLLDEQAHVIQTILSTEVAFNKDITFNTKKLNQMEKYQNVNRQRIVTVEKKIIKIETKIQ